LLIAEPPSPFYQDLETDILGQATGLDVWRGRPGTDRGFTSLAALRSGWVPGGGGEARSWSLTEAATRSFVASVSATWWTSLELFAGFPDPDPTQASVAFDDDGQLCALLLPELWLDAGTLGISGGAQLLGPMLATMLLPIVTLAWGSPGIDAKTARELTVSASSRPRHRPPQEFDVQAPS
jgi:hypothetical protein